MENHIKLALKDNNTSIDEPCAICGKMFEPDWGVAMFLANSYEVICDGCGKQHDPNLYRLLEIHRSFKTVYANEEKRENDWYALY